MTLNSLEPDPRKDSETVQKQIESYALPTLLFWTRVNWYLSLGLQIAKSRSYLYTFGLKVSITYILGALGLFFANQAR